jgi:hypothetical protein
MLLLSLDKEREKYKKNKSYTCGDKIKERNNTLEKKKGEEAMREKKKLEL